MSAEPVDYASVLADLKARRAALDQAIAAIEAIAGEAAPVLPVNNGSGAVRSVELDTFFNLSILDAAKKYLGMVGRKPQNTEQIADALRRGGLNAKTESVGAILQRALKANDPDLERPGRGLWGLAAWYGR